MDNMDWGEALDFVSFGHVNPDQLDDSDIYILVATQNVVGSPIINNLIKMVSCLSEVLQNGIVQLCEIRRSCSQTYPNRVRIERVTGDPTISRCYWQHGQCAEATRLKLRLLARHRHIYDCATTSWGEEAGLTSQSMLNAGGGCYTARQNADLAQPSPAGCSLSRQCHEREVRRLHQRCYVDCLTSTKL